MICPSCNQLASSWLRNSLSLQGVTLVQSFNGQLRCQHCGVLLRNVKYGKQLWFSLAAMVVSMGLIILLSDRFIRSFGIGTVAIYWVVLIIMVIIVCIYGMWKYGVLQKVDEDAPKKP
jgi:hypothetical protein